MRASRAADFKQAGGRSGATSPRLTYTAGRRRPVLPSLALGAAVGLGLGVGAQLLLSPAAYAQGRAGNETEEESIFKRAEEQFNSGNYEGAAELYDQALKLNPTRVESFVKRATLYFRERNYNQAIDLLTRAEKLSTSDVSIKTVLGLCLYESGQKDRGLTYLEEVTRLRPEAYEAQFQIGKHYSRTDPVRASTALEQYFRFRPEEQKVIDPSAQLFLGTAYFQRGKYKEAQKLLEQAQEARQHDNQIRQMLGSVYIATGDFARGAAQYEPLLSDVKRRPAVAFNLATCYLRLGRREEARKLAQQYQSLRRDDPRVLPLLAAIDQTSDKEPDAREALKKYQDALAAQNSAPDKPELQSRVNLPAAIARAYLQLRDAKHAIEAAESGLSSVTAKQNALPGGSSQTVLYANYELELRGLLLEAQILQLNLNHTVPGSSTVPPGIMSGSDKLLELAPAGDPQVLALAGSAAYATANFDRARKFYADAQRADPKLPRARIGLARTLEQLAIAGLARNAEERESSHERERDRERHEQERLAALTMAVSLLREAQKLDDSPSLTRNLAAVLLQQNSPSEADHILAPALAGAGRSDSTLWRLQSRTQLLLGRMPAAQEAAERAVAEAKKALDATPPTDLLRKAQLSMRLNEARLELGSRYLAMDTQAAAGRDAQRDARERERLDKAIDTLIPVVKELSQSNNTENRELVKGGQRNLSLAYLRRGRLRLLDTEMQISKNGVSAAATKQAEDALNDLQRAIEIGSLESANHERGNAECLAALAAVQAGQSKAARDFLTRGKDNGCELVPPYNRLGTELIAAFINYRGSSALAQREQLLKSLPKLQSRAGSAAESAPLQKLLRTMLFSTNLALAYDYHINGKTKLVGATLRNAQKSQVHTNEDDEAILAHNLAVAEISEGHSGGAEKVFERLGSRPPEALVNLGILYDRRGEIRKALDLYRKALERGARTGRLREWIDTKDRLLGQAQ